VVVAEVARPGPGSQEHGGESHGASLPHGVLSGQRTSGPRPISCRFVVARMTK
jgi:hypothetical protein